MDNVNGTTNQADKENLRTMSAPRYRTYWTPNGFAQVTRLTSASDPMPEYSISASSTVTDEDGTKHDGLVFVKVMKDWDVWPTTRWFVDGSYGRDNNIFHERNYKTLKEMAQIALAEAHSKALLRQAIRRADKENK